MSGNFEVVPCGTLQRLAQVEAERNALLEALDKIACFAPGYGEECEIIAKVARAAIAKVKGGGNG